MGQVSNVEDRRHRLLEKGVGIIVLIVNPIRGTDSDKGGNDSMKAEEVAEIRVELKGHKGFRNLKIRELVRTRLEEIEIQFVDGERNVTGTHTVVPGGEGFRDRHNMRADLGACAAEAHYG